MKNLPIGTHTFKDIINDNNLYVDKTEYIYNLIKEREKGFYFLSRPRRFGKSLLLTTLQEIFLSEKELFKDLWIYDKYDFKKYPVLRFDFSKIDCSDPEILKKSILFHVLSMAQDNNIILNEKDGYKENFFNLLKQLSKIDKVVILIDEYDKPIVDHIDNLEIVSQMKEILKNFYITIKACDEYIKFGFLTGVSKFSRISIFSGLNNLTDITLDENYSKMLGYTQEELEYYFDDRIKLLAEKLEISFDDAKKELKTWYNGYSWDGINFVYNPFSILNVLKDKQINNYWFKSGTPTFLIKLLKDRNIDIKSLENLAVSDYLLDSFEIENINVESLLFQTGYLTIKEIKRYSISDREYILNYPNMEVKESLLKNILSSFLNNKNEDILANQLYRALNKNDVDEFFKVLIHIFSHIPSVIFMKDKEAYYHSIIYIILSIIGVRIGVEINTNKGRIDAVIETQDNIYIMEFKMNTTTQAMKQIKNNQYYQGYLLSKKPVYLVGVSFDSKKRNIKEWKVELISDI